MIIAGIIDLDVIAFVIVMRAIDEMIKMFEVTPSPFIVQYL